MRARPEAARRDDPAADARVRRTLIVLMAVWGLNWSAIKAISPHFDPSVVALLRMWAAALALGAIVVWRGGGWPRFTRSQWPTLLLCATLMIYLNQLLVTAGMLRSSATHGALIVGLGPVATALLTMTLLRERPSAAHALGIALGFAGVALVVGGQQSFSMSSAGFGDVLLLLAIFAFAAGGLLTQRLAREIDALTIAWAIHTIGALMLLVHVLVGPARLDAQSLLPGWQPWLLAIASGAISTGLGGYAWGHAIATFGAARASTSIYWLPVFGVGFGALLLGEPLSWRHAAGLALVLAGTFLGLRRG